MKLRRCSLACCSWALLAVVVQADESIWSPAGKSGPRTPPPAADGTIVSQTAAVGCSGPQTPGDLRAQLLENYDKFARPNVAEMVQNGGSLADQPMADVARVQFHVLALKGLDQKRNEYQLTVWYRRSWMDPRLAYTPASQGGCFADNGRVGFPESMLDDIWKPDFYIENQAKPAVRTAGSIWIEPNGRVLWSSQLEMTIACKMGFKDFPYDVQQCYIRVSSYMDDASALQLDFFEGQPPVTLASQEDTADIPQGGTAEWKIIDAGGTTTTLDASGDLFGAYSYAEIHFDIQRNHDYYSDFVLVPAVMFVVIGWLSFFINRGAAPARVAMSMIGFLANMNFLSAQLGQLPRLGTDVWLLKFLYVSTFFSFYAILEYVVCNYLMRIEARLNGVRKKAQELKSEKSLPEEAPLPGKTQPNNNTPGSDTITKMDIIATGYNRKVDLLIMNPSNSRMYVKDEHVEIFSRYAYPVAYAIVSVVLYFMA